jgi:hypothetical protein
METKKVFIGTYGECVTESILTVYKTAEIAEAVAPAKIKVLVAEDELRTKFSPIEVARIKGGSHWIAESLIRENVTGNMTVNTIAIFYYKFYPLSAVFIFLEKNKSTIKYSALCGFVSS